jgi:hypothetical protein
LGLHRIEHPIDRVLGHRMASMENVPDPTPGRHQPQGHPGGRSPRPCFCTDCTETNQPKNSQAKGREVTPPSPSTAPAPSPPAPCAKLAPPSNRRRDGAPAAP